MFRRLTLLILVAFALFAALVTSCEPAAAATFHVAADGSTTVGATFSTASVISLLVGTVLPLLVGAITRLTMNAGVKALVLLALSAITAVLSDWLVALNDHHPFAWQGAVLTALATFLVGIGAHYQIWKPTGLAYKLGAGGIVPTKPAQITTLQPSLDLDYGDPTLADHELEATVAAADDPGRHAG